VNIASRIEALTKTLERPLLLTAGTAEHLREEFALEEFPPQAVRGVEEPMRLYSVRSL
jgi:adenylate cyclase